MKRSSEGPEEQLDRLFAEAKRWSSLWGLSRLMRDVTVEFSDTDDTRLGRCDLKRMTVTLNVLLLLKDNEELLFETLCHELAHIVAVFRYGPGIQEHGPEWQEYMQRAGFHPRPVIPIAELTKGSPSRRVRGRPSDGDQTHCAGT
jgi:hypothetical protein